MKAALNGVPSLSVLDGWWLEGHVEGVTGWAIGASRMRQVDQSVDAAADAAALYDTLERTVLPLYYRRHNEFVDVMRYAIALNGSFFTAQRMLQEYMIKAYTFEQAADEVHVPSTNMTR
jgi:starch phosphorylase